MHDKVQAPQASAPTSNVHGGFRSLYDKGILTEKSDDVNSHSFYTYP